ncbi:inner membrane transporter RhtA [Devosia sp. YR412]|uniref:EamA family transporter n=1 Tax=Devosia sp. YR412 TaxID=1881030 RepID=UPI0008B24819|nr:EamA family transporter [Devosia sp. YR412]SEQ26647.1 inner membrane transporter RhtA [Devosia sp. YR412]
MRPQSVVFSVVLVAIGMVFTQTGASFAKGLFPAVGPAGATALRLTLAAIVLVGIFRPWRHRLDRRQWRFVLAYGAVMGAMNLFFYAAIQTIPLGVAVALEFTGPLAVALAGSRKPLDFAWIILAVAGLALLLPLGQSSGEIGLPGVLLALATGACWAGYIIFGQRAGIGGGPHITALGVSIAAVIALPFGIATAGTAMLDPAILPVALAVALLSSAIPYALDMVALPHIPSRLFGILMSGQPALGALSGFLILNEVLNPWQLGGIIAIIVASLGATVTIARNTPAPVA